MGAGPTHHSNHTTQPGDAAAALACLRRPDPFLQHHLQRLRDLPAHGNRTLHYDQLVVGLLCAFYDPMVRSLRLVEDQGNFGGAIDLARLARSTTADALATFDPAHLKPIISDLLDRVPQLAKADPELAGITRAIIAADGTYLTTFADVAWALHHTKSDGRRQGQVRLNVQIDARTWTPRVISVSGDDGSEPKALAKDLLSDVCYVLDRNFLDFGFLQQLLDKNNDVVLRLRANAPAVEVLDVLPLLPQDAEAGVVSDRIVRLTGRGAPQRRFREVIILTTNRSGQPERIRLLSSLTATRIAAHVIGTIYRRRWQIELFFKWLKTVAGMKRLMSTSRDGITLQFYVTMIAVLMMYVQSGHRVSVYAMAAMCRLVRGQCTIQDVAAIIEKRERERLMNNARQAKRRAMKKLA